VRPFAIRHWLTDDQKRRAASATYYPDGHDGALRTEDDRCPLAVALWPDHDLCPLAVGPDHPRLRLPSPRSVERALAKRGHNDRIYFAAQTFIVAVDTGKIPPDRVGEALGVEDG
jgi:hypothetical protein